MYRMTAAVSLLAVLLVGLVATADEPARRWTFCQSTGELLLGEEAIGRGYSGAGEGLNAPEKEAVRNVGPIPAGEWIIGEPFEHETCGPLSMRLTPRGHAANGRSGFLIHGDNARGDKSASRGCIILSRELRQKIADSGIRELVVVK
jgi:hypothetical protein